MLTGLRLTALAFAAVAILLWQATNGDERFVDRLGLSVAIVCAMSSMLAALGAIADR